MSDTKFWSRHVASSRSSGLSRAEYARREGLAASALQYWARKIGSEPGSQLVRVKRDPAERANASVMVLEVQGVRILVGPDFDEELLGRVLNAVRDRRPLP